MVKPTHCSHNLCLKTELAGKTASKVANATFPITRNIGYFPYVIEHVTARKEQDNDQTDGSPQILILYNWEEIWRCHAEKGYDT